MVRSNTRIISTKAIRDFARRVNRNPNLGIESMIEEEFNYAVEAARQQVGAEKYALWMLDDDGKLRVKAHYGLSDEWLNLELDIGESISGTAVEQQKSLPIEDITKGLLVNGKIIKSLERKYEQTDKQVRSALVVPLVFGGKIVGTFNAYNEDTCKWTKYQEIQMETIAEIAASAITLTDRNERIQNHVADITHKIVSALVISFGQKSSWTYDHQERVHHEMWRLIQKMDLPAKIKRIAPYSARMHDLGKFSISDRTLNSPNKLSEEEKENMSMHTIRGVEIIQNVDELSSLIPGIRDHHEREDGSGYPDGKKANDIDIIPAMIAVLDSFDAMAHPRPYKVVAMPYDICMDEICMCSKLPYNLDRLRLFRTLENIKKSNVASNIKERIRFDNVEMMYRSSEDEVVSVLLDMYKIKIDEPEQPQYRQKVVEAYVKSLEERHLIN